MNDKITMHKHKIKKHKKEREKINENLEEVIF
jgi:hypothetical protein